MFATKRTLGQILGVFNKVMKDLEQFVVDTTDEIKGHEEQIVELQKAKETAGSELSRAKKVITQIEGLIK